MSSPPPSSPLPGEPTVKKRRYGRVSSISDAPASCLQIVSPSKSMDLEISAPVSSLNSTTKIPLSFEGLPIDVF
ncbi:hypothetical protein L3Y34_000182 [Caenorhabditis briggsae]|uniref:Uncharacterized protein n=1 Tax=Caenorhabditis briggsae TaxID=6238 RepID=A0AAE9D8K1_CAEBR|nr:hypothetical protein L3Y34_000182 [Caenorhabditis briggsae]